VRFADMLTEMSAPLVVAGLPQGFDVNASPALGKMWIIHDHTCQGKTFSTKPILQKFAAAELVQHVYSNLWDEDAFSNTNMLSSIVEWLEVCARGGRGSGCLWIHYAPILASLFHRRMVGSFSNRGGPVGGSNRV
jgi:hypothetical protein